MHDIQAAVFLEVTWLQGLRDVECELGACERRG